MASSSDTSATPFESDRALALFQLQEKIAASCNVRAEALLQSDASRVDKLSVQLEPMFVDFSKHAWDGSIIAQFCQFAQTQDLEKHILDLFDGEPINRSEQRSAMHAVLRADLEDLAHPRTRAAHAQARASQMQLSDMVDRLLAHSPSLTDVIHVGIGGSDLGPRLLYQALRTTQTPAVKVHFLANLDGHALDRYLATLDANRTAVILVSKSFSTHETLLNGRVLQSWLKRESISPESAELRLIAVTAKPDVAARFGVRANCILPIWEWLGGRYSVWSAVSLSIALAFGMDAIRNLQRGARLMDRHFAEAPWSQNIPVMLAFASVFNRLRSDARAHAIVPYDNRLALLPAYLQQLVMESNGKTIQHDASPANWAATPTLFGGVGTEVQHAFFQALHQGADVVPVDFIGVLNVEHNQAEHQRGLLANLLAQSAALLKGRTLAEAMLQIEAGLSDQERFQQASHRVCPGDRPSTVILLQQLNAESLGVLLAMYEHQTFVQAVLAGINPFDQFGVELGKQIAHDVQAALQIESDLSFADASTKNLIQRIRASGV